MNRLNESHFSFKCPMNLEDMQATAHGRFCGKCKKEVFDLTNCSLDEVRELELKHGSLCGSIRMAQVATVAISLAAAACQEKPENRPVVAGMISAPPSSHEKSDKENPRPTTGSIRLPSTESTAPPLLGKIRVPPEKEEEKSESTEQPSIPSGE